MLIDGIIDSTAKLLGMRDGEEVDERRKEILLAGLNRVISELAEVYFPLIRREKIKVLGGLVKYSDFSRTPVAVTTVFADGKSVPFSRQSDGLKAECKAGEVEVVYSCEPKAAASGGETEWEGEGVPARILEYGTATEFCIANGLEDDAAMWDKRYRDAIEDAVFLHAPKRRIRARRWRL